MKIYFFCLSLLVFSLADANINPMQQVILSELNELTVINQKLLNTEDDAIINELINEQNEVLARFILQLQVSDLESMPLDVDQKRLNFLANRITINKQKNNLLAVKRDAIKIAYYETQNKLYAFILYLKQVKEFINLQQYAQTALQTSKDLATSLTLPKYDFKNTLFFDVEKNHIQFKLLNDIYQDILVYALNNPQKIIVKHWSQQISLINMIAYVNNFALIKPINYKLSPFKIDLGGILISILIVLLVYFIHPLLFNCTKNCIERYVLEPNAEYQAFIYLEVRRPFRTLLIFFGLDLASYALLYKTDYRTVLEGVVFVIYCCIYVWFLFVILNSLVLLHVRNLNLVNGDLRKEFYNLGLQISKAIILLIALTICLNNFGIDISAIVSTLGIGGLAFALAAKDTLSNLFGGLTILFDNVFRFGDWIKIGDIEGTVAEIGLRSTTIRTFDNALIIVPNASVSVSNVQNWNRRELGRRIKMYIGVTYESDMHDIRQAIQDIRMMLFNHPEIANPKQVHSLPYNHKFKLSSQADTQGIKNTQLVFMDRYNESSIDILVYCFSNTTHWDQWLDVKEDVLFKIADILKQNNLEFAYPTQVRINRVDNSHNSDLKVSV